MKKIVILLSFIFIVSFNTSFAQISTYKAQALFIYNFTKHIKWPSSHEVFTIGILGKSDIINELNASLKGKQVDGKNIQVISISTPAEAKQCQLLYIPVNKSKEITTIVTSINSQDVLVVSENDLSEKGAGISFVTIEDKLRFKINQEALNKGGLQISGGLVSLALR